MLSITIDKKYLDDPKMRELYELGHCDGDLSFEEAKGHEFQGAIGKFKIESDSDFRALEQAKNIVVFAKDSGTQLDSSKLWTRAFQSTGNKIKPFLFNTTDDIWLGKPEFRGKTAEDSRIIIPLNHNTNWSELARYEFSPDPKKTQIVLEDGRILRLDSMGSEFSYLMGVAVTEANAILDHPAFPTEFKMRFRKILFANNEEKIKQSEMGKNANDLFDAPSTMPTQKGSESWEDKLLHAMSYVDKIVHPMSYFVKSAELTREDYDHKADLPLGHYSMPVYSPVTLNKNEIDTLQFCVDLLPPDAREFIKNRGGLDIEGSTLAIAVIPDEEYRGLNMNGVYGNLPNASYHVENQMIYLPQSALAGSRLELAQHFAHEFTHSLFDSMSSNSILMDGLFFTWHGGGELVKLIASWLPSYFDEEQKNALVLCITTYLGFDGAWRTVKGLAKLKKEIILGIVVVGGVSIALDDLLHFDIESEGLLPHEYDLMRAKKKTSGQTYNEITISNYGAVGDDGGKATLGFTSEFPCVTLHAYFNKEAEVYKSGVYNADPGHGLQTREELKAKHPALFLAYEFYFAPDSPLRYQSVIFRDEFYPRIYEILDRHHHSDGSYNINTARSELFASFTSRNDGGDGAYKVD